MKLIYREKFWVTDQLSSVTRKLFKHFFVNLLMFFLFPFPSWFSLQDSFEYINQDPQAGKLNPNQNSLGPCRTGSNLGKGDMWTDSFFSQCYSWGRGLLFVVFQFSFALSLTCVYLCVCLASSVCSALGLLQACSGKLLQGVSEGGPLRLTRSASFFAGLCGMLSTVWPTHVKTPVQVLRKINPFILL